MSLPQPQLRAANADEDARLRNLANRKITASLFLQQLIYYTLFFDIAWIVFWVAWLFYKYWRGLKYQDPDIVRTIMLLLWGVFEPVRMTAGWYGNVQENLPWLILFVILTFAPLQVVVYYLMLGSEDASSLTKAVQYSQAIITAMSLVVGVYAAVRMSILQKQQYYLFEYVMNQRRRNAAYRLNAATQGGIGSKR